MGYYNYGNSGNTARISLRVIIGAAVILFGIVSYFSHQSVNPVTGERQYVTLDHDQEVALGLQSAPSMIEQMGGEVSEADARSQEVRQIGAKIAATKQPQASNYPFQYHLLSDTQTINAFALPGGQIFITLGLYTNLADEAELAGVLGHETGHVVERHVAQQIAQSNLGKSLVLGTGIAASGNRNGLATWALTDLANQMLQLRFSREDESQADQCGLQYMTDAGYDPRAMIDVMKVLKSVSAGGGEPEFLETHPDPGNRIEAIDHWMQDNPYLASQLSRGDPLPQ